MEMRNKYRVSPPEERTVDGQLFASKAEARRYKELLLLTSWRSKGMLPAPKGVSFFLRQVPFHLPGGVVYRVDFQVHWNDGSVTHEDVKGYATEAYKIKKRLVEALYPVTIEERK